MIRLKDILSHEKRASEPPPSSRSIRESAVRMLLYNLKRFLVLLTNVNPAFSIGYLIQFLDCEADGTLAVSRCGVDAIKFAQGFIQIDKDTVIDAELHQQIIPRLNLIEDLFQVAFVGKALCALSGGVDSSVAAALLNAAIGENLTCIFVDHGLMRKNEGDEVEEVFGKRFKSKFIRVNAEERFLSRLAGVEDPETKRKIIGEEFINVFEEEAKKIGKVDFLVQGTIYPDVVESGKGIGASIKSHHNVGGLPDHVDFKEIVEPLRDLFKDEVTGLAIRVIGDITKEKLDILREADYIFREELERDGINKISNQYFAALTNVKSVGVMGDYRTYDYMIALRAVTTMDFMTATFTRIPYETLERVSSRIVNEVKNVNRVVYDITGKPPATIEYE